MPPQANVRAPTSQPIKTAAEADALARRFAGTLEKLLGVVERETGLVRAGHINAAAQLETSKTELTRAYVADMLVMKANKHELSQIAPGLIEALRRRHDEFRALLQINLTVLATAHAVSESIIRGVSGELSRKAAPQTYGATGRANQPAPRSATPLAVSRSS